MGLFTSKHDHARNGTSPRRRNDRRKTPQNLRIWPRSGLSSCLTFCSAFLLGAPSDAQTKLRVAFYNSEIARTGPGLQLRDLQKGDDPQINAVLGVITLAQPDILVLQGIDWDLEHRALGAFTKALTQAGHALPHTFFKQPNRGKPTGLDLDGNGRTDDLEDAQSYAEFTGQNGIAVLSRYPIADAALDFTDMLWSDLPGALLPVPGWPAEATDIIKLSTTGHWIIPFTLPDGPIWIATFGARSPIFDGAEDRNGRRNHDEIAFWSRLLDGDLNAQAPENMIIIGNANSDPNFGEGRKAAIQSLLANPLLQDSEPRGAEGLATVDWADGPGKMRVGYILPDQSWEVLDAGIVWPEPDSPDFQNVSDASRHRLVWVDVVRR